MNVYERKKKIHDVIACFNKYILPWLPAKIMFAYLCMNLYLLQLLVLFLIYHLSPKHKRIKKK
jgi:hypothetical protein